MAEWTRQQQALAQQEGWDIFECDDSEHPPFELQTIGAPTDWENLDYTEPKFVDGDGEVDDVGAWRHVLARASRGSGLHVAALAFLKENSPEEYEHVSNLRPYEER